MAALPLSRDRTTGEFRFHIQSPVMVYSMLIFGGMVVSFVWAVWDFNWIYLRWIWFRLLSTFSTRGVCAAEVNRTKWKMNWKILEFFECSSHHSAASWIFTNESTIDFAENSLVELKKFHYHRRKWSVRVSLVDGWIASAREKQGNNRRQYTQSSNEFEVVQLDFSYIFIRLQQSSGALSTFSWHVNALPRFIVLQRCELWRIRRFIHRYWMYNSTGNWESRRLNGMKKLWNEREQIPPSGRAKSFIIILCAELANFCCCSCSLESKAMLDIDDVEESITQNSSVAIKRKIRTLSSVSSPQMRAQPTDEMKSRAAHTRRWCWWYPLSYTSAFQQQIIHSILLSFIDLFRLHFHRAHQFSESRGSLWRGCDCISLYC